MDHWDATVIRQLTTQRHAEDIARGLAAQHRQASLGGRPVARTRRAARFASLAIPRCLPRPLPVLPGDEAI